jgi:curved DNA-binding protein CbpA
VTNSYNYNHKALSEYPNNAEALAALNLAFNILGDPEIKTAYDVALKDHIKEIRSSHNYYAILNIPEFTTVEEEIYDGRFNEVMRFQPPQDHTEAIAFVEEAYAVLSDPEKKEKYDAELRSKKATAES